MKAVSAYCAAIVLAALALSARSAVSATLKLDIVPFGVEILSGKDPRWDTVEIKCYVYNSGDTTYVNAGTKPLLYLDVRVDTASVRKHYLAAGDSIPAVGGFFVKDTVTLIKAPVVVTAFADPLRSFHAEAAVAEARAYSQYYDLHPKVETITLPGCPPGTVPVGLARDIRPEVGSVDAALGASALPAVIHDVLGRPVWSGRLLPGEIPPELPEGQYVLVRSGEARAFRIARE